MQQKAEKYVVVAVLNWGLGHATRMVPLINALQDEGFTPVLASDGLALEYLSIQFPQLQKEKLPAYNIHYSGRAFLGNIIRQLPKLALAIRSEHRQMKHLVKKYGAVGIVSDNRLGAYHKTVPGIYVTHQLSLRAGVFSAFAGWLHRVYINRFSQCLVPDIADEPTSLAGALSHRAKLNIPMHYIGPLSRFMRDKITRPTSSQYAACIVLSGPEPSRSAWEEAILKQVSEIKGKVLLIRGSGTPVKIAEQPENLEVIDLADAVQLREAITQSEVLISRSGYSSLMDYCFLDVPVCIVPTPGQTEQEYLAERMRPFCAVYSQAEFSLKTAIDRAKAKGGLYRKVAAEPIPWKELFGLFEGK